MPALTIWSVRFAMVYLGLGCTFGALMLWNKGLTMSSALWSLLPAHIDFLLFGWTVQLILGVSFWILPRFKHPPKRGNEKLAWGAVILLNAGVLLVAISPFLAQLPWILTAGRAAQLISALLYMLHAWPRIKPTGT